MIKPLKDINEYAKVLLSVNYVDPMVLISSVMKANIKGIHYGKNQFFTPNILSMTAEGVIPVYKYIIPKFFYV